MIDHGFAFNGPGWEFSDSPLHGLYPRHSVYDGVRSLADFEPWLGQTQHFPEEAIDLAWKRIPSAWVAGEEDELERMLERLYERRSRLPRTDLRVPRGHASIRFAIGQSQDSGAA